MLRVAIFLGFVAIGWAQLPTPCGKMSSTYEHTLSLNGCSGLLLLFVIFVVIS